ncbi:MAG: hypothetical protein QG594_1402 [Bacteroidota bacterium]|nr:hypothetical protein [Bacteroidota bacterium]
MFNQEFFPTPSHVIELMCEGLTLQNKVILEPSAGKGDIIDFLLLGGAEVLACETNTDLQHIIKSKCKLLADDFFTLASDKISHINAIVMNPPFSNADKHILHAFNVAPDGCKIIALCNVETVKNTSYLSRKELLSVIEKFGSWQDIGNCFEEAERQTSVNVALVTINKPGESKTSEFEGFFMDDEPEEQANGIMSYNFVRDLVNRYIGAIKIFDKQLDAAVEMNKLTSSFYHSSLAMDISENKQPIKRNEFKKDLQKAGWRFIFDKMNMKKNTTRGLMEDINKFVEQQTEVPFTMRNIYRMIDIVIGTTGQRMDKALLEVFDKVTGYHDDNKQGLPGFKTNSHFLLTKRFIHPYLCTQEKFDRQYHPNEVKIPYHSRTETFNDLIKALCYLTGDNYDDLIELEQCIQYPYRIKKDGKYLGYPNLFREKNKALDHKINLEKNGGEYEFEEVNISWGEWFEWAYFRCRCYKKGTMHFEFKSEELWGQFNQRIAKIKGYPLFEAKKQTAYQDKQTGRKPEHNRDTQKKNTTAPKQAKVLFEIELNPFK